MAITIIIMKTGYTVMAVKKNKGKLSHCYKTGYVNNFDAPVVSLCKQDYYIAGISSYHNNHKEDRRFDFKCCKNTNQCIRNCKLTSIVNQFDGSMNYKTHGKVIVGAFSWHDNYKE